MPCFSRRSLVPLALLAATAAAAADRSPRQYTIEQFMATTWVAGASFSPDETKLLFSSDESGIRNAYVVPVTGGAPTALTKSTTDSTIAVSFFPNDERVLFTRDEGGNELNHLYVREKDGRERDLTPGAKLKANFGGWTRAGDAFYVLTNERDPRFFDVYRYASADYQRTLVYQDEVGYFFGGISDDGKWIALTKVNSTADDDIHLWNTATKEMKHLTPHQGEVSFSVQGFDPESTRTSTTRRTKAVSSRAWRGTCWPREGARRWRGRTGTSAGRPSLTTAGTA